nr:putative DNA-binding domain-containing protein [Bordetella sp. BOR01]
MPSLHDQQRALTRHLRDPLRHPPPACMKAARVRVYRELIPANLTSMLGGTFPVLVSLLGPQHWSLLVQRFLRDHRSHTPRFGEIAGEFLAFLAGLDAQAIPAACWRPFMVELAHYEWVEMVLMQRDAEPFEPAGQAVPLDHCLRLSPLAWPLAYAWPVHRIGPQYQPGQPSQAPTLLLVRRDPDDIVRFSELSPLAWHLLQRIAQYPGTTGRALLQEMGYEAAAPDLDAFIAAGAQLLHSLVAERVLALAHPAEPALRGPAIFPGANP